MQIMQSCTAACKGYNPALVAELYAARACCTVCSMHTERPCEAMVERVIFEADLGNCDSLSRANFVGSGTALI